MTNDRVGVLFACAMVVAVGSAFAQTFPVRDVSPPGEDSGLQALAVDPQGNAIVIWDLTGAIANGSIGNGIALRAARYVAATDTWGPAVDLITSTDPRHFISDLVMDPAGNAIAVGFRRYDTGGGRGAADIITARYSITAGKWSPFTVLGPFMVELASSPQVVIDAAGNATVVWLQGSCFACVAQSAYAARYSPTTDAPGTTGGPRASSPKESGLTFPRHLTLKWHSTPTATPSSRLPGRLRAASASARCAIRLVLRRGA